MAKVLIRKESIMKNKIRFLYVFFVLVTIQYILDVKDSYINLYNLDRGIHVPTAIVVSVGIIAFLGIIIPLFTKTKLQHKIKIFLGVFIFGIIIDGYAKFFITVTDSQKYLIELALDSLLWGLMIIAIVNSNKILNKLDVKEMY